MNGLDKIKGIKIILKDGTIDYYDPCEYIQIDNGEYVYKIKAEEIVSIETYENIRSIT